MATMRDGRDKQTENVHELTAEEAWELFDEQARYYLDMSGEEFLREWDAGRFDGPEEDTKAMRVAMLLPLVREADPWS